MLTFIAILPLLLFFISILFLKQKVLTSAIITLSSLLLTGTLIWHMETLRMASAGIKGLLLASEIILIIFGAILILEMLKKKNLIDFLKNFFESISTDRRVHVILIGWCLVYFLEGIAGFGTPAIIAVPIFLALGFSPITAVVISLIGDSVPVIFGAVGLPVTYGIASVIPNLSFSGSGGVHDLGIFIAGLNLIGNILMPIILLFILNRLQKDVFSHFVEFIPFAFMTGSIIGLTSFITAIFLGPELPSIIGGFIGLVLVSILAKKKFLLPKTEKNEKLEIPTHLKHKKINTLKAIFPYSLVLLLLLLSRLPMLPFKNFLTNFYQFKLPTLFNFNLNYNFQLFYSAGIIMIFSALISYLFFGFKKEVGLEIIKKTSQKVWRPFLSLAVILIFIQIYLYSGENLANLPAMLTLFTKNIAVLFGSFWPFLAPSVGALGSITAGSATVSNLIFSDIQYQVSTNLGIAPILILSLQGLGASAGNMGALHNIISALAVAGLVGKEGLILRKTLPILIFYLIILGILGLILAWFF